MKKNGGNLWNLPTNSCNRLVAERIELRRHEKHIRALESTKGMIDTKQPTQLPTSKSKARKLQEDRAAEIQLENRILLQKMLNIDSKPSEFSTEALQGERVPPKSLYGGRQRRELDRITTENQKLLYRLQNVKPSINPLQWEDEEVDRQALKFRMCQNSNRGRVVQLRLPDRVLDDKLPSIGPGSGRLAEEEWAGLTNAELDQHLRELERGQGSYPQASSSSGNPAGALQQ
jgi:E3 ubiquitin-protein ligase TRIP12